MALIKMKNDYHSLPSSAKVKNEWNYTSTPAVCLHCVDRDNFSSMIITNINGDECPVDPDDISGMGKNTRHCIILKNII
jgi:hypothetical protein